MAYYEKAATTAIELERKACAEIADEVPKQFYEPYRHAPEIARAIRSRGEK